METQRHVETHTLKSPGLFTDRGIGVGLDAEDWSSAEDSLPRGSLWFLRPLQWGGWWVVFFEGKYGDNWNFDYLYCLQILWIIGDFFPSCCFLIFFFWVVSMKIQFLHGYAKHDFCTNYSELLVGVKCLRYVGFTAPPQYKLTSRNSCKAN